MQPGASMQDQTAQRHGSTKALVRQSAAEQREENRADVDEHGGGASVDVTFAPAERDHIQPEPEQSGAENSGLGCPGRPVGPAKPPYPAEGERGHKKAPQRERTEHQAAPPAPPAVLTVVVDEPWTGLYTDVGGAMFEPSSRIWSHRVAVERVRRTARTTVPIPRETA